MIHIKIRMLTVRAVASLTSLLVGAGLLIAAQVQAQTGPQTLPTIKLGAGMMNIRVELADNPATRQIGLMHRKSMPTNDGMLFVFERAELSCFWMRNTLIPLSIAFLADDGSIVNIADMKPLDETSHCPARPVRLALEMNQGWFVKHGLKAGDKLTGAPFGTPR
ncbi:MAG: hypothetical protein RLZZ584_3013 [Pseudomonadota bacterium]|jgi:uncharacterized membrane protein (UPF0127 family)